MQCAAAWLAIRDTRENLVKLFQNLFTYPSYVRRLDRMAPNSTFLKRRNALLEDGCNGVHALEPVLNGDPDAFLTVSGDERLQRAWARENGLLGKASLDHILLAQIEHFQAEVFYTQLAYRFGPSFMKRLPGSVRKRVCWHAPPANPGNLTGYDLVLNNFPRSLELYAKQGVRTAYFAPSFDPVMADYCDNQNRPLDVAFVGGYSRHHRQRVVILEAVAELGDKYEILFSLNPGRLTHLAETPLGWLLPIGQHARPECIRKVSGPPLFGRDMYDVFSKAKIVLNGAVDSAEGDRGNMRCFEAMGCGALLLTDTGRYPEGMEVGRTIHIYDNAADAVCRVHDLLANAKERQTIAKRGLELIRHHYSKQKQWQHFQRLVS
jgi:glycosyl transferase family 1